MSQSVVIVAESGFGKTTSLGQIPELGIKGLDPSKTFIVNVKGKSLPFRGWKKNYTHIPDPNSGPPATGNYLATTNAQLIIKVLKYIDKNRPDIENVVLDDFQYVMSQEFMDNALKSGFEKFNKLAKHAFDVIDTGISMRDDINFFVLTHEETKESGFETTYKIKTIGKMLDDKVTLEGLFTVILYGKQIYDDKEKKVSKQFVTNFDGQYPAKSPVGMFNELYIPNDLGYVIEKIHEYNEG